MIFYFSGTGNSKWVAEQIANILGDDAIDITKASQDEAYTFEKDQKIGLVFPVYAWRPPAIVMDFIEKIQVNGAFTYAVCTCADECGYTMKYLTKRLHLDSGYAIIMPNNYIIGNGDVESAASIKEMTETAKLQIEKICSDIENNQSKFDLVIGKNALLKTNIISVTFNKFARKTKPFQVNAHACIGCGLCQMICPSRAISLKDGHPVWVKDQCYQCLGCINRCPVRAIDYGDATQNKGRYYFKED